MRAVFGIMLCVVVLFSCENGANRVDNKKQKVIQDSVQRKNSPLKQMESERPIVDKENMWVGVEYDKEKGDYYIEKPCDGHIPNIKLTKTTLVDDRGMDEPITYQVQELRNLDSDRQLLQLSYKWNDGELTDSIIIRKTDNHQGVYQWTRYPRYNGKPQDNFTSYFVFGEQISKIRTVKVECPDQKQIELEKKPFE
ncbi:hypothetical protein [Acidiluteibacter ferrifornacis]|uniref:Lipoprotein n=1 Tax=Acidiluteibacter ferrifornacis TaxID=2692424 RepID=A0A6N9NIR3_9FLAO|nr:hypothetical protein [Acidiluteibacter ferrifornacis]NBG65087.1 hypothetical protein [Acidiluteibacter ferrifornacis]